MPAGNPQSSVDDLIGRHPTLAGQREALLAAFELLRYAIADGRKVLACGNGGSASDAEHIVGELMKRFALSRPIEAADRARLQELFGVEGARLADKLEASIPALSLVSPVALGSAIGNDTGFEFGFAQQVYGLGSQGDVLIALSTSGNSANVIQAARTARLRGLATLGLTGAGGGKLAALCDVVVRVPADETHLVQELHLPVYHWLCYALEAHFFGQRRQS